MYFFHWAVFKKKTINLCLGPARACAQGINENKVVALLYLLLLKLSFTFLR